MQNDTKQVSVMKFVWAGVAGVLILNFILIWVMKTSSGAATAGIAVGIPLFIGWWFYKSTNRSPTKQERSKFLWSYGGIIGALFFLSFLLALQIGHPNAAGVMIMLIHYLPYPAFAQFYFSEKNFNKYFVKQT